MPFYDWNKKNDVISDYIGLKTHQEKNEGNSGTKGLGCSGIVLLSISILLFCCLLAKGWRIWVSLALSAVFFAVLHFLIRAAAACCSFIQEYFAKRKNKKNEGE